MKSCLFYALLSAVSAALVSIFFSKIGCLDNKSC